MFQNPEFKKFLQSYKGNRNLLNEEMVGFLSVGSSRALEVYGGMKVLVKFLVLHIELCHCSFFSHFVYLDCDFMLHNNYI